MAGGTIGREPPAVNTDQDFTAENAESAEKDRKCFLSALCVLCGEIAS
jgi:hypothetical protein